MVAEEQRLMDEAKSAPFGNDIKVLDHGYIRGIDFMGKDESIIEAARMSTGKGFLDWDAYDLCRKCGTAWRGRTLLVPGTEGKRCYSNADGMSVYTCLEEDLAPHKGDANTLEFMYKNRHTTPFEMCELAIEVQAPIMVFREWHRSRTQSYSEFSARYAQMPDLHYLPDPSRIQKQSTSNKQGSAEALSEEAAQYWRETWRHEQDGAYESYDDAVGRVGIAKEVARINTPVSRYSKMRAKTDLHNWLGFLRLRMAPNAQWEIRQFAWAVAGIVKKLWPRTWALFEEHDLYGVRLSRTEAARLREIIRSGVALQDGDAALCAKLAPR